MSARLVGASWVDHREHTEEEERLSRCWCPDVTTPDGRPGVLLEFIAPVEEFPEICGGKRYEIREVQA